MSLGLAKSFSTLFWCSVIVLVKGVGVGVFGSL